MFSELWEVGVTQGLGIFFFLFLVVAYLFWQFVRWVINTNQEREMRYLKTINDLTETVKTINSIEMRVIEMRQENKERADLTNSMIGRLLDRLGVMKSG